MNYYTSTIPLPLAEKLKEKGMPIRYAKRLVNACPNSTRRVDVIDNVTVCPMCCEVFDWLMSRDINISIEHRETSVGIGWYPMVNGKCPRAIDGKEWYHSANAAIEKALTLI